MATAVIAVAKNPVIRNIENQSGNIGINEMKNGKNMDAICKNCRHSRCIEVIQENGLRKIEYYCHASRNYAKRDANDTCKRYHFNPSMIYDF